MQIHCRADLQSTPLLPQPIILLLSYDNRASTECHGLLAAVQLLLSISFLPADAARRLPPIPTV